MDSQVIREISPEGTSGLWRVGFIVQLAYILEVLWLELSAIVTDCVVDDMSSVSEVSENETDDDSEPSTTNTCSDCRTSSQFLLLFLIIFIVIVILFLFVYLLFLLFAFIVLMLLVGWQEGHPACNKDLPQQFPRVYFWGPA